MAQISSNKLLRNVIIPFYTYLRFLLIPLIPLYLLIFFIKWIITRPKAFDIPIICIGNITTGGSGKTPSVVHIARLLKEEGYKPAIVSRGYKGSKSNVGALVSDGLNILLTPEESGDEPYLMAMRLKNIPIAIGRRRGKAIQELVDRFSVNVIIMDDGFQNNSIRKDIAIITVDATMPFGNGLILPAGNLREPKHSLTRANLILITKSNMISEKSLSILEKKIRKISGNNSIFNSWYEIDLMYPVDNIDLKRPVSEITGKRVLLVTAIGNPAAFFETVKTFNPEKIKLISYPDHYDFTSSDCENIIRKSKCHDYVITTEKDFVKLKKYQLNKKFYALKISMAFDDDLFEKHLISQCPRCDSG